MGLKVNLNSHLNDVLNAEDEAVQRALEMIGLQGEAYAKSEITRQKAIDTGRLRNSISHEVVGDTAVIGTNVEYASYVELGTSKMKARPYLRPAAADHADEYKKILLSQLEGM